MRSDEYVLVGSRTVLAAKHGARGNFFKCCAVDRKSGVEVVVAILKSKWGRGGYRERWAKQCIVNDQNEGILAYKVGGLHSTSLDNFKIVYCD